MEWSNDTLNLVTATVSVFIFIFAAMAILDWLATLIIKLLQGDR